MTAVNKLFKNVRPELHKLVIGATMSGKSYLCKYLITQMVRRGDFQRVICVSPTNIFNHEYDWLGKGAVHDRITDDLIAAIKKHQKRTRRKKCRTLLVLDDVLAQIGKSDRLSAFLSMCRHMRVSVIVLIQYANALKTGASNQFGERFVFTQPTQQALISARNIGAADLTMNQFKRLMNKVKKIKHSCLFSSLETRAIILAPAKYKHAILDQR